jgi:hypothetical protein
VEATARAELDAGDIAAGIAHYKIAISIDPGGAGRGPAFAQGCARAPGGAGREPSADAVRWAREAWRSPTPIRTLTPCSATRS